MDTLYYGDNLDILQRYLPDASVDLVYLDPPFNSAQNYNAFFQEKDGTAAAAQIQAFEDRGGGGDKGSWRAGEQWEWNTESQHTYEALSLRADKLGSVLRAFMEFLGPNDRGGGGDQRGRRAGEQMAYSPWWPRASSNLTATRIHMDLVALN